jgi:ABC-type transport system substrate-binding protein
MSTSDRDRSGWLRRRARRRSVLRAGASGVVSLAGLAAWAGCSPAPTGPAAPTTAPAAGGPAASGGPTATVAPAGETPKYGGVARYPISGDAPHLDPHQTNAPNIIIGGGSLAYSRLVKADAGPNRKGDSFLVAGDLAESWTQPDDLTYIFKLRPGIKWQNIAPVSGRALVAEDVRYSFERILGLKTNASFLAPMQKVEAVDPQTVKLTLSRADADFLGSLANYTNVVVAKEAVDVKGDLKEGPTIGTGPWLLDKWEKEQVAVVKKNPDYFLKGLPYMDGIEFPRVADFTTAVQAFRAGQLDEGPSASLTLKELNAMKQADPGLQIIRSRSRTNWMELMFDLGKPPFNDLRVRQAFQLALDRPSIYETVFEGLGFYQAPLMLPDLEWILPEDELKSKWFKRDVAGAKQLLAQAGFPNGLDVEITHMVYSQLWNADAELEVAQLKEAGIRATLKPLDLPVYIGTIRTEGSGYQVSHATNFMSAAPNAFLFSNLHSTGSQNFSKLKDPKVDELIEKQSVIRDLAGRKAALADLQRYLLDQVVPSTVVYGLESVIARRGRLRNRRSVGQAAAEADLWTYAWLSG